jgi:hypothetical protein
MVGGEATMSVDREALEAMACVPEPVDPLGFNPNANLPYGLTIDAIARAMTELNELLQVLNGQLHQHGMERLESLLMSANFSSVVSEFIDVAIPKFCPTLVKNAYHNGHPDLIPTGQFPGNAVQYSHDGIEVKASRYPRGWQGHNKEESWLMVFVFDANRPSESSRGIVPRPFRFLKVLGARLERADWTFSGRSEISRRTITASVAPSGYAKMEANLDLSLSGSAGYSTATWR